ncbi:MAG: ATP-binding protein [Candidatus Saccharibacteria bacterium]
MNHKNKDVVENNNALLAQGSEISQSERIGTGKLVSENEEKFRILFETMSTGIVFQDAEGNIISANSASQKILGLTLDKMLGRTSMNPEWRPVDEHKNKLTGEQLPPMISLQSGKSIDNFVLGIYNPALDDYVWLLVNSVPLFHEGQKNAYQVCSTFMDITDRKKAEEALLKSQGESKHLLEVADKSRHILLSVVEDEQRARKEVKDLNERLNELIYAVKELSSAKSIENIQHIVAFSARKLTGADGATIVLRDNNQCYYADEDAISPLWKGKRFPMEMCISGWVMMNNQTTAIPDIYADERIPIEAYRPTFVKSLLMVPVITREPVGAIGIYWSQQYAPSTMEVNLLESLADATARSIENIQLNAQLEERVKLRTQQLEAANKELETFTYSVSHDLKAPLRGIDGYSRLLQELYGKSLNEEATRFIATIRSSTLQMNQLIEDLLQYSRLERSHLQIRPLKVKSYIESILKMHEEELTAHHFDVKVMIPDAEIVVDPNGIQIVLRNLIGNAIKFTKKVVHPAISIMMEEKPDNWLMRIVDNGIGFDMKYSERIFEIFQRLQRAEDYPGTGVGLAMVAKAMHRMNGKVWAQSAPGEGAAFYLEFNKTNA